MGYIGIYCSASTRIRPIFNESAIEIGKWIGQNGMTLINGGSNQGLMEILSRTVHENGGHCIGVVPSSFEQKGWFSKFNDETIYVRDLGERKDIIKKRSDILVVFPGGVGSMDEFFDAWASYNLGFHNKHIILANIDGFYNPLLKFINSLEKENFLHESPSDGPVEIANSVDECIGLIEQAIKSRS